MSVASELVEARAPRIDESQGYPRIVFTFVIKERFEAKLSGDEFTTNPRFLPETGLRHKHWVPKVDARKLVQLSGTDDEREYMIFELSRRLIYVPASVRFRILWVAKVEGRDQLRDTRVTIDCAPLLNSRVQVPHTITRPQLVEALFAGQQSGESWPEDEPADLATAAGRRKAVEKTIEQIHGRFGTALETLWRAQPDATYRNTDLAYCELTESQLRGLTPTETEEAWAQHLLNLTAGAVYQGPGSTSGIASTGYCDEFRKNELDPQYKKNWSMYVDTSYFAAGEDYDFCSLVYCCQQLTTFALLARGYKSVRRGGVDAYSAQTGVLDGRRILVLSDHPEISRNRTVDGPKAVEQRMLGPGVCFWRTGHVGMVLRAHLDGSFQMLDTGGWIPTSDKINVIGDTMWAKPHGDGGAGRVFTTPVAELMLPPAVPGGKGKLVDQIGWMRKLRAMGVARLVISARGGGGDNVSPAKVIWMSPLLPLFLGSGSSRIPLTVARLWASLRGLPHRGALEARWVVYLPQHAAFQRAMLLHDQRWWEGDDRGRPYSSLLFPVCVIADEKGGTVSFPQRAAYKPDDPDVVVELDEYLRLANQVGADEWNKADSPAAIKEALQVSEDFPLWSPPGAGEEAWRVFFRGTTCSVPASTPTGAFPEWTYGTGYDLEDIVREPRRHRALYYCIRAHESDWPQQPPYGKDFWSPLQFWVAHRQYKAGSATQAADMIDHRGDLYRCIQTHTADPEQTPETLPATWRKMVIPVPPFPEWKSDRTYMPKDMVTYDYTVYGCLRSTAAGQRPDRRTDLWSRVRPWQPGANYFPLENNPNRILWYFTRDQGHYYECLEAHRSAAAEPPAGSSKWKQRA